MSIEIRFDIKNNIESINGSLFPIGTNFINFISINMTDILNDEIISSLSKTNYKEILNKITTASANAIVPEIVVSNVLINKLSNNINIEELKKDFTTVLKVYNIFKELTEFCYFNEELKNTTPFQNYIYYLNKYKIEKVILPKRTISSFGLKPIKASSKILKNDSISVMLKENSPFFYYCYECSTIDDYMIAAFLELIENDYLISKCENCGKFFIAYNRADTLYCDRISPQNTSKNCKQYGKEQKWLERTKNEKDWYSLYRKVYQTFQKKAIRNPGHKESRQAFDNFRAEANEWKQKIKKGTKTEEDFMSWLQNFRQK
jgi:hypothetical protein